MYVTYFKAAGMMVLRMQIGKEVSYEQTKQAAVRNRIHVYVKQ